MATSTCERASHSSSDRLPRSGSERLSAQQGVKREQQVEVDAAKIIHETNNRCIK
jgi:hypothetical protein